MSATRTSLIRILVLAVVGLFLAADYAEARAGRGGGFGSRGTRTFQAPPPTRTAPEPAQPVQRTTTPQPAPAAAQTAPRPAAAQPARPGLLSTRGGFLGGLVGAGLLGMLLGYGLFGGLGGLASILGLLLQVALIVLLVRLALGFFRRRSQPAYAGAPGPMPPLRREPARTASGVASARGRELVPITQADLDSFERALLDVQAAYAARDLAALDRLATPEVVGFLAEELGQDERRGVVNHVAGVKLLQGDVAESWREGARDYATVAMRFALRDWTTDAAGRVVDGDPDRPTEATELWAFVRERGGPWRVSAIQPA
mgnify:CR=1 FL=1